VITIRLPRRSERLVPVSSMSRSRRRLVVTTIVREIRERSAEPRQRAFPTQS
jgi:hypothetical protein